jgi:signal transduction histidine kinase
MPFETRYFYADFDADGTLTQLNTDHVAAITEETATEYAARARDSSRSKAFLGGYRYRIYTKEDGGMQVIFVDCNSDLAGAGILLKTSLFIGLAALVLMYVLVRILAGIATAPVVESLEKQKRFISDAGHELKTPLTIISANVDVLEMTGMKNEWTGSIRNQVRRMTALITNMLTLTRMEEEASRELYAVCSLSEIAEEAARNYEAVAAASHKTPGDQDFARHPRLRGAPLPGAADGASPGQCHEVLGAGEPGSLYPLPGQEDPPHRGKHLYAGDAPPRETWTGSLTVFYRGDASRTSTGSFGIGLSAARAICQGHGGTITAERVRENAIRFTVLLPPVKTKKAPPALG